MNCSECQNKNKKTCSELGIFMYRTCNSMNNLSSYCGLVDAKIRASDKDLPVIWLEILMIHLAYRSGGLKLGYIYGYVM